MLTNARTGPLRRVACHGCLVLAVYCQAIRNPQPRRLPGNYHDCWRLCHVVVVVFLACSSVPSAQSKGWCCGRLFTRLSLLIVRQEREDFRNGVSSSTSNCTWYAGGRNGAKVCKARRLEPDDDLFDCSFSPGRPHGISIFLQDIATDQARDQASKCCKIVASIEMFPSPSRAVLLFSPQTRSRQLKGSAAR